jgi:hypothetical protein
MRSGGVDEYYITGDADPREKFRKARYCAQLAGIVRSLGYTSVIKHRNAFLKIKHSAFTDAVFFHTTTDSAPLFKLNIFELAQTNSAQLLLFVYQFIATHTPFWINKAKKRKKQPFKSVFQGSLHLKIPLT